MSGQPFDRPAANSIEAVDIHLRHAQGALAALQSSMDQVVRATARMATTDYIDQALAKLDTQYAGKAAVDTLSERLGKLEDRVTAGSVANTLDKALSLVTRLSVAGTALAGLIGLVAFLVRWSDKLPKP